jgi:hypothetical protein
MATPNADGRSTEAAKRKGASQQQVPQERVRISPNAAGIEVGAEVHYVAVPEDRAQEAVRPFGCCTQHLHALARGLKECGVETVAMESTGVYWVPLLEGAGGVGLRSALGGCAPCGQPPGPGDGRG